MDKYLIINADDFGMSHEFNIAITELIKDKYISSTSIMANGCAYEDAVALAKSEHLRNVGVHLALTRDNFTVEEPLIYHSLTSSATLESESGLYTTPIDLKKNARFRDIVNEVEAQIRRVLEDGIDYTHIDNHMYSLMPRMGFDGYHAFFKAYHRARKTDQKCGVRIAKSYYLEDGLNYIWSGRKLAPYINFNMKLLGLCGVDYSFAFPYYAEKYNTLSSKIELLDSFLKNLKDGVTELHVHPCVYSENLKKYNPFWENRVHEYELLKEFGADRLKTDYGITLISYQDLK